MLETLTSINLILIVIAKICGIIILLELIPTMIGVYVGCDNILFIILCPFLLCLSAIVILVDFISLGVVNILISLL